MPRSPSPGRARLGVSLMFFTNGVLFSALLPRYPEVKEAFALSDAAFGLLVVAFPAGSILAAGAGAPLVRRIGARGVTALGSLLLAGAMAVAGASASVALFMVALVVAGALDAVVDAAQNIHGVVVEQWRGRSIINSLHALWSLGAASGGLIGAWAVSAGVSLSTQMLANGAVWSLVAVAASWLAAAPGGAAGADREVGAGRGARGPRRSRPWLLLVPLVVMAICGTLIEDVANNWVVLFLDRETGAPLGVASIGFTVVLASQFVGRLAGDPMTDRWGRGAVARSGGALIAVGVVLAMFGGTAMALVGFALTGLGSATLVPAAFAAAGRIPGLAHGTGIAVLGWLMRIGFLVTSPAIGVISQASSLRVALAVPLAAGLLATVIAHRSTRARTRSAEGSASLAR